MGKMKNGINLVVLGHVDSGKSTTTGHLIYKCGFIDNDTTDQFETETKELGQGSARLSWVLDKLKAKRERGITTDATLCTFETEKFRVTVIDAPGHRNFVKNMITGASKADCALFVVSATPGKFEASFSSDEHSIEQARLVYALGVKQLIIVINKMDMIQWAEDRYNEICSELRRLLKKIGYKPDTIPMIPISGQEGDNLLEVSTKPLWFKGAEIRRTSGNLIVHTLTEAIDAFESPQGLSQKPLRLPIQDIYKVAGIGQIYAGRVESGVIRPDMSVLFAPSTFSSQVLSMEMNSDCNSPGVPGDNIGFSVKDICMNPICRGSVVSELSNDPAKQAFSFTAQIIVTNHPGKISAGYTAVIDIHTAHIVCEWTEIIAKINPRTNQVIEKSPNFIKYGESAIVKIVPIKPLCVEAFSEYPSLGRFAVRDMNHNVAVGIILEVEKRPKPIAISAS